MSADTKTYDLVLLLDPKAQEASRARVLAETRTAIESAGQLSRHDQWGLRPLAYPISKRTEAEYHLFQLQPGDVQLISQLDRSLRLSDEVLRFLISKVKPGTPEPPSKPESASKREPEPEAAAA